MEGKAIQGLLLPVLVDDWVNELGNQDPNRRKKARRNLNKIGWEPRNDTEKAYWLARKGKWIELAKLGAPAIKVLMLFLLNDSWSVPSGVIGAFSKIGAPAVEPLKELLKDKNLRLRHKIVSILGKIRDEKAIEALKEISMKDEDGGVRKTASEALEKLKMRVSTRTKPKNFSE